MIVIEDRDLERVESLGRFLEEHGIPSRIEESEVEGAKIKHFHYYVCVADEDLERAQELRHEHLLIENPEIAEAFGALPTIDQCPACGSRVSPESAECPSCGLALDPAPAE